ncbi:MAG TPA: MFS transporter [Labilithrix sp.]|nr:MFS transporter [Labilithrix sp.]
MSPVAAIFLIVLVDVCSFTLVIPLLPLYAERLSASPLQATLLVSTFALFQLLSGPMLGRLSDKVGRKPVLILSQIGTLIGLLVLARAQSLWVVYLARAIDGATAGNISLAQAYISDHTKPQDRAKSFSYIFIAFGIGFFIGPLATGLLAGYGLAVPIYAGAGLSLLSIVVTAVLLPREEKVAPPREGAASAGVARAMFDWRGYLAYFKRPVLQGLFAEMLFFGFCFANFTSGIALFDERRFTWKGHPFGAREIAFHFAIIGLFGIILQAGLVGRLVRRFREPRLVRAGFVSLVVGYMALALIHSTPLLVVVTVLTVFGHGILRPTLGSLVTQNAGKHEQGVVLGISQSIASLSQVAAPVVCGLLISRGHLFHWSYLAAIVALFGIVAARRGSARHGEA